jgi:hypothetical protein
MAPALPGGGAKGSSQQAVTEPYTAA